VSLHQMNRSLSGLLPGRSSQPGKRVLPAFALSLGISLFFISVVLILPTTGLVVHTAGMGWDQYLAVITDERVVASYKVTLWTAALASVINALVGLLLAWVLVRYEFPGKRIMDALVDLPFALPTAVAGITLAALFAQDGWYGQFCGRFGIQVSFTPLGTIAAMSFTSLPFVGRTVEPVLEDQAPEDAEAAVGLGASDWTVCRRILLPAIWPALLTGFGLCFCRS